MPFSWDYCRNKWDNACKAFTPVTLADSKCPGCAATPGFGCYLIAVQFSYFNLLFFVCFCSPNRVLGFLRPLLAIYSASLILHLVTCCFTHSSLISLFLEGLLVCVGWCSRWDDPLESVWKTVQWCHSSVHSLENQPRAWALCKLMSCETV